MDKTISEVKQEYYKLYQYLVPGSDAANFAREIWSEWNKAGITSPDIDSIVANFVNQNNAFFQEIVQIASKVSEKELQIDYCPFILNSYNLHALSVKDGYLVFVDEIFLDMLYSLVFIFMYEANSFIQEDELNHYAYFIKKLVIDYFNHESSVLINEKRKKQGPITELYKKNYETAEFAVYLYNSFKIFLFAHEISHHILGHKEGTFTQKFSINGRSSQIKIDKRKHAKEFEADVYGYKIFLEVINTVDDSINYAYCKYRYEYAPLFLFDIFDKLDRLQEEKGNIKVEYSTHPSPLDRKANLQKHCQINDLYYYDNLKDSLNNMIIIR